MSWITLDKNDVLTECSPQEAAAITAVQGVDNIANILNRAIAEVRGAILSGDYELNSDPTTVPDSLAPDVIAITRWRLLNAVPGAEGLGLLGKGREKAYEDSIKKLSAIADQQIAVEPVTPGTVPRTGTWNSENKILMRTHPAPRPGQQTTGTANDYANPDAPQDNT